jgi:hypothetical protein
MVGVETAKGEAQNVPDLSVPGREFLRQARARLSNNVACIMIEHRFDAGEKLVDHGTLGLVPTALRHDDHGQFDRHPEVDERLRREGSALGLREYLRSALDLAPGLSDVDCAESDHVQPT